jgi:hypothetical protein
VTQRLSPRRRLAAVASALVLVISACADPRQQPAQQAIDEIDAALAVTGTGPVKYAPGELKDVQARIDELKRQFAAGQFDAVLAAAPEVLAAVRELEPGAAARAAEFDATVRKEWAELAAAVPGELAAMRSAVERVTAAPKLPEGLTVEALPLVKQRVGDAQTLWDRALREQAEGRLPEAVILANQARNLARQVMDSPGVGAGAPALK